MVRSLILLASAVAVVAAQTTTVEWWIPSSDTKVKDLKASVLSVDGDATILVLDKDSTSHTIASGPSTLGVAITVETDGAKSSEEFNCQLDADKDQAVCDHAVSESRDGSESMDQTDTTIESYQESLTPITVTAGVDKLGGEDTTATDASSATAASKPKATEAEATDSGNAAAPMATQNAVFAGVAAVVGGAAVLL
ncbi:hypothetical protein ACHAPT_008535 [Fusarium lateritium]